jgi:hypothetical protein
MAFLAKCKTYFVSRLFIDTCKCVLGYLAAHVFLWTTFQTQLFPIPNMYAHVMIATVLFHGYAIETLSLV